MAFTPVRQFNPTTATTFLDSFQTSNFILLRYNSAISHKTCKTSLISSSSTVVSWYYPHLMKLGCRRCSFSTSNHESSKWLCDWNKSKKLTNPKPPQKAVSYRNRGDFSGLAIWRSGSDFTGGGSSTMEKIVEKLKKFGYMDEVDDQDNDGDDDNDGFEVVDKVKELNGSEVIEKGSVEDILYVQEGLLPNTRGGFSKESPLGVENLFGISGELGCPWEMVEDRQKEESGRRESRLSVAETTLPESELIRLRNLTFFIKSKTKVGGGGVTQALVDTIQEIWKTSEIVRLKIEGAPAVNMKRMHEILERKTGGLVIWRSGTSVSLYRGVNYEVPPVTVNRQPYKRNGGTTNMLPSTTIETPTAGSASKKKDTESLPLVKYEDEVDKLLDGLGPRYLDWQGGDPLPIDADLLPGIVPGYQPPFRVLPYGVRSTLKEKESTALRRIARVLPPHFALGRNRQLQGLAVAMIKLWEKCSIVKVAIKRGVQLATSERMADGIKKLTGGILLSRNKDFLVFYRGKNFLAANVADVLLERERLIKSMYDEEEQARLRASDLISSSAEGTGESGVTGTLVESLNANSKWGKKLDNRHANKVMQEAEKMRYGGIARRLERKLAIAERKLVKAEQALSKVEEFLKPSERQADPESITDEERFMFRKLGLRMKAFLLLGRRGVFDGTVQNMHLHWKYRELVKIIFRSRIFDQVKKVALALEAESGGVLISVDKVSKGYAIVVYRGKDYLRPSTLRPTNLLTKRKALARSIELQRREAIIGHLSNLHRRVERLKLEIESVDQVNTEENGLYEKLTAAYSTDDEEMETDLQEEGDEAYLDTYNSETEDENEVSVASLESDITEPSKHPGLENSKYFSNL